MLKFIGIPSAQFHADLELTIFAQLVFIQAILLLIHEALFGVPFGVVEPSILPRTHKATESESGNSIRFTKLLRRLERI